jgi:hypothetical protein
MATPVSLGCWYFTLDPAPNPSPTTDQFLTCIQEAVQAIDGVSELEINRTYLPGESDRPVLIAAEEEEYRTTYTGPHLDFESINFVLDVSTEVQCEVAAPYRVISHRDPERFRLVFMYGWAMPLSCVAVMDRPGLVDDTSTSAVVTLRYLQRELSKNGANVALRAIPPIFAKADFYLDAGAANTGHPFWRAAHSRPLFDRFEISYDPQTISDPVPEFLREVGSELDIYFQLVDEDIARMYEWQRIDVLVSKLTAYRRARGPRGMAGRTFRSNRLSSEAIIRLIEFAARDQTSTAGYQRQLRDSYHPSANVFMEELVREQMADRVDYPVEQFSRLVQMLEERRLTDREMAVLITSSLIGGSVGAIATVLASG